MAKGDSGLLGIAVLGVVVVGGLYFTRQFCPGGMIPVEGLCYAGEFLGEPGSSDCMLDPAGCGAVNTDPLYTGPAGGPKTATPTAADRRTCERGYVKGSDAQCHCNRIIKKCASNQVAGTRNGICMCATCPAGMKRRASSAGDNICIKAAGAVVTGGTRSAACSYGYVRQATGCVCNRVVKRCAANSVAALDKKWCVCKSCPAGYKRGTASALDNRCLKVATPTRTLPGGYHPGGVQIENGKNLIASLMSTQIRNCTGRTVTTLQIRQGFPSGISSLAAQNNYQSKIVQYNNRPFAKLWRAVILGIVKAYRLNLKPVCTTQFACINSRSLRECKIF